MSTDLSHAVVKPCASSQARQPAWVVGALGVPCRKSKAQPHALLLVAYGMFQPGQAASLGGGRAQRALCQQAQTKMVTFAAYQPALIRPGSQLA